MIIRVGAVVVGVAAAAALGTGCGSSTTGHGNPASSAVTSKPAAQSSAQSSAAPSLDDKVLQLSDMPAGWSVDSSSGAGTTMSGCTPTNNANPGEQKDVQYAATAGIPQLSESLGYFGTPSQATTEYQSGVTSLNKCSHFTIANGGAKYTMTLGAMSFAKVGDQSSAYLARTTIKGTPVSFALVAVRKGGFLALIEYGTLGSADTTQLQDLVTKAASRMG